MTSKHEDVGQSAVSVPMNGSVMPLFLFLDKRLGH